MNSKMVPILKHCENERVINCLYVSRVDSNWPRDGIHLIWWNY